ncbi:MAG: beta-propeller fold lactonase family protein, partial [Acidobacteriia bacterium]|nr:beta-propeller fold lactonase family protein [Terriglobia bacterium]
NLAIGILGAPSGDALWALYRDPPALIEIPFDSFQPRRRIRLPSPPDDFDLDSKHAAIASSRTGSVIIASLEHAAIERSARAGPAPFLVRFQQQGAQLAAASPSDRSVSMIEAASGKLMVRLPMPIEPSHFCLYGDGGQLFVTGQGQDVVVIIDPYRTQIAETILAGRRPGAMAVAGAYLLVTNPETNSVTVLDVENRKLAAVVQVGEEPRTILITPDQQYALVLNEKSGDVAVIRIASLAGRRYKSAPLFTLVPVGQEPVSAAVVTLV